MKVTGNMKENAYGIATAVALLALGASPGLRAQESARVIDLDLDRMVELAMESSYDIRQLNLQIERTRYRLEAEQAGLRSRVFLEVNAPTFEAISDNRWNSDLQRYEIARENSRRWEAELSVRQPVVLFGYPTNGYLSLNNRVYRYTQLQDDGERDVRYYNRYYVAYEQPLFQPNRLKHELEEARLDLEDAELDFQRDVVRLVSRAADDWLDLFENAYQAGIYEGYVDHLEEAVTAAEEVVAGDSARTMEADQIRVELANARESLQQARSEFRLRAASAKQRLGLEAADSLALDPTLDVVPVSIEPATAVRHGLELTPRLRQLAISLRGDEIDLENTEGRNSFRVNLELSYGREMQNPYFEELWAHPSNSYTVDVSAYVPIWDWGERDADIAAARVDLESTKLRIEESESQIVSDVRNEARNVQEFQDRALAMEENLRLAEDIADASLERFRQGSVSALDLLQSLRRESDTAENLLDAYLGWRQALLRLQELTFFDYERGMPVLERFGIEAVEAS